jgi:phage shock protein E
MFMKVPLRIFIIFSLMTGSAVCQVDSTLQDSIWRMIDNGALVIDVRTQSEYDAGHLDGALHIPYTQIADTIAFVAADTNMVIVLYCKSGIRSGIAEKALKKLGYNYAINGGRFENLGKTNTKIDSCVVR